MHKVHVKEVFFNRLLVEEDETPDKIGGIIIPDTVKNDLSKGRVVDTGFTCNERVRALVGKKIIWSRAGKVDYRLNARNPNERITFITDEDIIAVIEEEEIAA